MLTIVRCIIVNTAVYLGMDIREKFGAKLKILRLQKGLSQEALALAADLDRTYIPSIEKGQRNVSITVAEKLAKALNLPLSKLFEDL